MHAYVWPDVNVKRVIVIAEKQSFVSSRNRFNELLKKRYLVFGETDELEQLAKALDKPVQIYRLELNDPTHEWKLLT